MSAEQGRRAIFIDSINKTVSEIRMPTGKEEADWRRVRQQLDCNYIEAVRLQDRPRETLWIDEEGFLIQPNPHGYFRMNLPAHGHSGIFAGHGLILGTTPDGYDTDSALDVEWVRANVRFLGIEDLGPDQLEPKITITSTDRDGNETVREFKVPVRKAGADG